MTNSGPAADDMTLTQAAGYLNASTRYVLQLLADGDLNFAGNCEPRIDGQALAAYKERDDEKCRRAADELSRLGQEMGGQQ